MAAATAVLAAMGRIFPRPTPRPGAAAAGGPAVAGPAAARGRDGRHLGPWRGEDRVGVTPTASNVARVVISQFEIRTIIIRDLNDYPLLSVEPCMTPRLGTQWKESNPDASGLGQFAGAHRAAGRFDISRIQGLSFGGE